jgi:3-oxocholest-4-en-26-oyl-CoA dehydrogenase beta subunit
MDFELTESELAARQAAARIFSALDPARLSATESTEERVDRRLWRALAGADLLGLAVPEAHGGAGLGLGELAAELEEQGRRVAPVPLWATLVLGALPLARFGPPALQERWLPGVVAGEVWLSAALSGVALWESAPPSVTAVPDGSGWRLSGQVLAVPQAHLAARVVIPVQTVGGVALVLADPAGEEASTEWAETVNREVHPHLYLAEAPVPADDVLVGPPGGREALTWLLQVARTGLCALAVGVAEEALARTAAHLNQREQFGRPLSAFQGTMLRAADGAIDVEAMRVTLAQAVWRLDTGRAAAEAVAVSAWQASERGQRVVHTTQHLHGGLGADIAYPIHRYFLWGKQLELMLGFPSAVLAELGRLIADEAAAAVCGPTGTR